MSGVWKSVQRVAVPFFVLALVFTVGVLAVRASGEGDRTQTAVTNAITKEQQRQADEQRRQAAEQDRQGSGLCADWKARAESQVTPATTELGRSLIRTAASNYELVGCEKKTGRLGPVDPEAYRPAPQVTPNPGR